MFIPCCLVEGLGGLCGADRPLKPIEKNKTKKKKTDPGYFLNSVVCGSRVFFKPVL